MANPKRQWLSLVRLMSADWKVLLNSSGLVTIKDLVIYLKKDCCSAGQGQYSDGKPLGNSWCCCLGFEYQLLKGKWTG